VGVTGANGGGGGGGSTFERSSQNIINKTPKVTVMVAIVI